MTEFDRCYCTEDHYNIKLLQNAAAGPAQKRKTAPLRGFDHRRAAAGPPEKGDTLVSDQPKKNSFFDKLATFIVDKRDLIFFLYIIAIIASIFTQSWVRVCNDLTEYLPESTETRRGLTLIALAFSPAVTI